MDSSNFAETNVYDDNTSDARKLRKEISKEPERIKQAVREAVDAIVFSLELGKVKKAELEELIAATDIKV